MRRPRHLLLGIALERDHATVRPDSKPEHAIEDGFFAVWCATEGVLCEERLNPEYTEALKLRRMTPRTFLSAAFGGLLWQADDKPEFDPFCYAYMNRLTEQDEATDLHDVRQIFGEANYWRNADELMTKDNWTNYDRIAPRYSQRLEQWRRREITSKVAHPH